MTLKFAIAEGQTFDDLIAEAQAFANALAAIPADERDERAAGTVQLKGGRMRVFGVEDGKEAA